MSYCLKRLVYKMYLKLQHLIRILKIIIYYYLFNIQLRQVKLHLLNA
jgi:hypothetical protein